jgi:Zn-dependent M28 family amino/carboxypeptidase
MRKFLNLILIFSLLSAISCRQNTDKKDGNANDPVEDVRIHASDFNSDSAFSFVRKQAAFGPRVPNTAEHRKCAAWLVTTLKRFTQDVTVQSFKMKAYNGSELDLKNIIGSFNPQAKTRILLCSHWDSRPYADNDPDVSKHRTAVDGVNDGASGVGILLETARQFSLKLPAVGVDILLLDGEDYGAPQDENLNVQDDWALGSQYWSKNPHKEAYTARFGILLDMVGAEGATFTLEGTSQYYAPDIMNKVWNIASEIGYSAYFLPEKTNPITDDHVYINDNMHIPTIDIIQYDPTTKSGFYKNWHTVEDNLNGIDKQTLMAVGQTVVTTVYLEK